MAVAVVGAAMCFGAYAVGRIAGSSVAAPRAAPNAIASLPKAIDSGAGTADRLPVSEVPYPIFTTLRRDAMRVATGQFDAMGRAVTVSCASCHANMAPDITRRSAEGLIEFHAGMTFDHADLSCVTCHRADNYNAFRLADGAALAHDQVILMCAQCHTPQARDFEQGAHGGMMGYWDRRRGPQFRKTCIDCHDPHAPAFPAMVPTFHPRDRFLPAPAHDAPGAVE